MFVFVAPSGAQRRPDMFGEAHVSVSRRAVLQTGTAAAFLLAIEIPARAAGQPPVLAGWLEIAPDNTVTIFSNTSEIGQGTGTSLAQLAADELDIPWSNVRIAMAPLDEAHINPAFGEYATHGSGGLRFQANAYRTTGARARLMLIAAAARHWNVPASECTTNSGAVVHAATKRKLAYGTLAERAAGITVPDKPALKPRESWRYIGKSIPRLDIPSKTNGSGIYGIDVELPGLKIATIAQCPAFGGTLAKVDPAPAMAVPGVVHVVPMASAVAVVANGYWAARQGLAALKPQWDLTHATQINSKTYGETLRSAVEKEGTAYAPRGAAVDALAKAHGAAMAGAASKFEAVYEVPFVSHAPMEPMNATARPLPGGMELWLPTQAQTANRNSVAKLLGVSPDKVIVHTTLSGGGFGRRGELDFPLQAAEIAQKIAAPVKLIWSREEDIQHDWYRPAVAVKIAAGLDASGNAIAWRFESACASLPDWSEYGAYKLGPGEVDGEALAGFARGAYAFAAPRYGWTLTDAGVPVAYWRSVGQSQNLFALESFIDELALRTKRDPIELRRGMLAGDDRGLRVLDTALQKSGWMSPSPGRSRGFAMGNSNGTIVAQVAELSVTPANEVRLHRITCVVDCGLAVNPNSVAAQMEGGIVFGLSTAFLSAITIDAGRVQQSNFHDFPLATLAQTPDIDVTVLDSEAPSGGAGEEAVGATAPAIANAIFAATGKRVHRLPFASEGFTLG
ncbi:MAG: molybdopterin cofactor-binding domain-containing protein [Rhizomicrobium sp.]|jgi:isoquinoline 1-oxidoreductase beta subunit